MPDPDPYQVLGPSVPPMLGRAALMSRIDKHLRKPSPDHVSVVGPAHYGKSVLLHHAAATYRDGVEQYVTAAYVDLRRGVPASDHEFMRRFADEIKAALQGVRPDLVGYFDDFEEVSRHEVLGIIFDQLEKDGVRLLAVLDGFDYALAGTGLTRNLWDQLRALAQRTSLRLVTGSRRPLRELCRTEESRTSDFWEIFYDTPVRVAALDDRDLEAFLQPLRDAGCELDESARKEVANWTGRVPWLVRALLQRLRAGHRGQRLSKSEIDHAAEAVLDGPRQLLDALWDDCDSELRADLRALTDGDIPMTELSDRRRRALQERGFGRESGNHLRSSCRLMQRHAQDQAPAIADLTRLMGTAAGLRTHVQTLLKLRLNQVSAEAVDELRDYVSDAIGYLAPYPERALIWVRSIAERALEIVWDAELPPDRTLPAEWTRELDEKGERYRGKLPRSRSDQYHILRLATGTERTTRCTRHITKTTSLLLDHLRSVGNFGQHRADFPGTEVTIGFAAAVVLSAISLVECLTSDLSHKADSS